MIIDFSNINSGHITRYATLTTSVLSAQRLVRKVMPDKQHGFKYYFKLTGATLLGLVGGTFLANVTEEYLLSDSNGVKPITNDTSSSKSSTLTKQTDSTDM